MLRFEGVSSLLMSNMSRSSMGTSQQRLNVAQAELGTGRHYDMGLALGGGIGNDLRLRLQLTDIMQTSQRIDLAGQRAEVTQSALTSISGLASDFLSTLVGARGAADGLLLASQAAKSSLNAFADLMNTSFAGQYVFGGTNSSERPVQINGGGLGQPVATAFEGHFGFPPGDAAASSITASEMSDFLEGSFNSLFTPETWSTTWTNGASANVVDRLGPGLFVDASTNANAAFAPKLAQAFSMLTDLGQQNLSDGAFEATVDRAMTLLAEAQLDLGADQSRIGIAQQRLTMTNEALDKRKTSVTQAISAYESVDPYEAATRVNLLMNQLETSYAITGRISRLSLLSYI